MVIGHVESYKISENFKLSWNFKIPTKVGGYIYSQNGQIFFIMPNGSRDTTLLNVDSQKFTRLHKSSMPSHLHYADTVQVGHRFWIYGGVDYIPIVSSTDYCYFDNRMFINGESPVIEKTYIWSN